MFRYFYLITVLCFTRLNAQTHYNVDAFSPILNNNQDDIPALILVNPGCSDSVLQANGITIRSKTKQVWSVSFNKQALLKFPNLKDVLYVEAATTANSARYKNDIERQMTLSDKVQNGLQNSLPKNYTGKGVIIGIVDIGFQCNHPTFFSADSVKYRVTRYWNQANSSGNAPNGYNYGSEYTDTAVIKNLNDLDGSHGTHVAGIAGGSGLSTPNLQYRGVAPDAELVFVTIKYANDTLPGSALGDYLVANPSIIDAYNYIFDYAESQGKPAVINLSWGMHTGPHDGTSLFDLATESLVGKGKIIVGANGNEGDNPMHFFHQFNQDTVGTIVIENNRQFRTGESVYCDFWGSRNKHFELKIRIIDTAYNTILETPFISTSNDTSILYNIFADTSNFRIHFKTLSNYLPNGKPNLTVSVQHPKQRKYAILAYIHSDSSEVHGWNSGAERDWTSGSFRNRLNKLDFSNTFKAGDANYTAGENGGTSKAVISVGALAARSAYINQYGKLINDSNYVIPPAAVRFSSMGPTVDGRIKPDISAPGYNVPSSINNKQMAGWMEERTLLKSVFQGDTQYWTAFSGTSMAAPHVTGIVALMLQVNPLLDYNDVRHILETTTIKNQNMGSLPNNKYGHGQVDAYSAVIKTLQTSKVNALNAGHGLYIYPNPVNSILNLQNVQTGAKINMIDLQGRVIWTNTVQTSDDGNIELDCSTLENGIYFINYSFGGEIFTYKLIKN